MVGSLVHGKPLKVKLSGLRRANQVRLTPPADWRYVANCGTFPAQSHPVQTKERRPLPEFTLTDRPAGKRAPLTAVLFTHLSPGLTPLINAWLDGGNRFSAVVIYRQKHPNILSAPVRWLFMQMSVMRVLRRNRIAIVEPKPPLDWEKLRRRLAQDQPDVAISYTFMRLIPQSLLSVFPRGAVNFHPALLPYYRGPKPLHWLAIDNALSRYGGVTLHEMTDGFDEGPIIAQVAVSDVAADDDFAGFAADAVACMARDVIPPYCAGEIKAWPQPRGNYPYAHGTLPKLEVQPQWTRSHLRLLCSTLIKRPGIGVVTSRGRIRLLTEAGLLGPPTGKPPVVRWNKVEFDLADQRVAYWRHNAINKAVWRLGNLPRLFQRSAGQMPIRLGPFAPGDQPDGAMFAESSEKGSAA